MKKTHTFWIIALALFISVLYDFPIGNRLGFL